MVASPGQQRHALRDVPESENNIRADVKRTGKRKVVACLVASESEVSQAFRVSWKVSLGEME